MREGHQGAGRNWTRVVVYADLNCPFCYALEERLQGRGIDDIADWKLVEHAPELPIRREDATPAQLEELSAEMEALAERAPDVAIVQPPFRSNSHAAIVEVARAQYIDPVKAGVLRRAFFRALWRDGQDISDDAVRQQLVESSGLRWPQADTGVAELDASEWTAQWRDAQLNRIPCMVADSGTQLLGLSPINRLELFLRSGLFSSSGPDACVASPKT